MIAAFCGGAAGLIDAFFVGDPLSSMLGKNVDKIADGFVKKAAEFFWNHDTRTSGKNKKCPQTLEQCISYLEQAFPVNYDASHAKNLVVEDGTLAGMRPLNHHLLSLAHSPDPIGLIFSIINQYMGYATFVDNGKIIHVIPSKTSRAIPYMQGTNFVSRLFCGVVNWLGHLISDLVGSSSTRKTGKTGRGAGIPIPFYELLLMCDFGDIQGMTIAETMIKVFEQGYDLRFGVTMAIPVIMEELMIKVIWMIRQKFVRKKSWKESMPTDSHADLRIMLIVGNATLCTVDGADAAAHSLLEGGNVVSFICHLNFIGWVRLVMLILKELRLRYGAILGQILKQFITAVFNITTVKEKQYITDFYNRLEVYELQLNILYEEFVKQVETEYQQLCLEVKETFNNKLSEQERSEHSVKLAKVSGVSEDKIVHNISELDDLFL